MRIWLINSAEPVPLDGGSVRLMRMGILADMFRARGHQVVWWSSTFRHAAKVQRFDRDTTIDYAEGYRFRFLHAPAYQRNISLARLWNHRVLGTKLRQRAHTESAPDAVLCSFPTLELSAEAVRYGIERRLPVVLDIRDMWPDVFVELTPDWGRWLARRLLAPVYQLARRGCAGASAITGHAPAFVEWGLAMAGRPGSRWDRDFPFGYVVRVPEETTRRDAEASWRRHGIEPAAGATIVCFFGAIGRHFDLKTVLDAARLLRHRRDIRFVICGMGPHLDRVRGLAGDCPNLLFPGWVDAPEIWTLMQMSSMALAPYVARHDFEVSIPNKSIEYLSAGLPILTSLKKGVLLDLLRESDCGVSYEGDAIRLAELVSNLSCHPTRRRHMASRALELFRARFEAAKVYGEMADHIETLARTWASPVHAAMPSE